LSVALCRPSQEKRHDQRLLHGGLLWRSLLALELLDAVAVAELPELFNEEAAQMPLTEVLPRGDCQVVLICRRNPLALEICSRICGWMEQDSSPAKKPGVCTIQQQTFASSMHYAHKLPLNP
jgi:hypothetical protein